MSIEIKFRAKRRSFNQWVYFDLSSEINSNKEPSEFTQYHLDEKTIGEYSRLKDKTGTEIYEGDIIKNDRGDWGVVVRKDHCFEVTVSENQSSLYTKEYFSRSEVIGNIFDNPELLQ